MKVIISNLKCVLLNSCIKTLSLFIIYHDCISFYVSGKIAFLPDYTLSILYLILSFNQILTYHFARSFFFSQTKRYLKFRCDLQCRPLTLSLLEPKVVSLCHQYRSRPACQSRTRLYTVGRPTSSSHLDIPINDNRQFQKWMVDYSI